jgi:hypothetical protein
MRFFFLHHIEKTRETLIYFFEKQKDGFFATLRMTKA